VNRIASIALTAVGVMGIASGLAPEALGNPTGPLYHFVNNAGQNVNDLHLLFDRPVAGFQFAGGFAAFPNANWNGNNLNLSGANIPPNTSVHYVFCPANARVLFAAWTVNNVAVAIADMDVIG
jgi:hypothetical protein